VLDRLFAEGLLRDNLPRYAADYPELAGDLHHGAIGFLARAMAQQNLPGTTWQ